MYFGNKKPAFLGLTEKALWRALMQTSITEDSSAALNGFLMEFQDLQVRFKGPEGQIDWYSPSCLSF